MTRIIKKAYNSHQKKMMKLKNLPIKRYFYLVKNRAGETINSFDNKKDALNYSLKKRGV